MPEQAMIFRHLRAPEYEFDTFRIGGMAFLYDPTTLLSYRISDERFDELNRLSPSDPLPVEVADLHSQGLFRFPPPPPNGQWGRRRAGITLMNTNLCNMRCPYCVMDHRQRALQRPSMPWDTARAAVDWLFDVFGKDAQELGISFSLTGEPLLNLPLMRQVSEYARNRESTDSRGVYLYMSTNATLINDEAIDVIKEFRIATNVSIDGTDVKHDALRILTNAAGSYERAREGAVRLLTEIGPSVTCSPTVTRQNFDIPEIFEAVWDLGFRVIAMKPVRGPASKSYTFDEESIDELLASYRRFADWLLAMPPEGLLDRLKAIMPPGNDYFGRMIGKVFVQTRDVFRCEAGKTDVAIDADGTVYSCFSVVGDPAMRCGEFEAIGSLNTDRFWSMSVDEREPCRTCLARYTCGGGCACTAHQANGDMMKPDPVDCAVQIFLTRLAVYFTYRLRQEHPAVGEYLVGRLWRRLGRDVA